MSLEKEVGATQVLTLLRNWYPCPAFSASAPLPFIALLLPVDRDTGCQLRFESSGESLHGSEHRSRWPQVSLLTSLSLSASAPVKWNSKCPSSLEVSVMGGPGTYSAPSDNPWMAPKSIVSLQLNDKYWWSNKNHFHLVLFCDSQNLVQLFRKVKPVRISELHVFFYFEIHPIILVTICAFGIGIN